MGVSYGVLVRYSLHWFTGLHVILLCFQTFVSVYGRERFWSSVSPLRTGLYMYVLSFRILFQWIPDVSWLLVNQSPTSELLLVSKSLPFQFVDVSSDREAYTDHRCIILYINNDSGRIKTCYLLPHWRGLIVARTLPRWFLVSWN